MISAPRSSPFSGTTENMVPGRNVHVFQVWLCKLSSQWNLFYPTKEIPGYELGCKGGHQYIISRGGKARRGKGEWREVEWWWWGLSSSTLPSAVLSACFWVLCASPYVLPSVFIPQRVAHHRVWGHCRHTPLLFFLLDFHWTWLLTAWELHYLMWRLMPIWCNHCHCQFLFCIS